MTNRDHHVLQRDKTGFCLQLRILLWKNFTLKKRSPLVFLLEVCIPLTLFIILLLIRKTQHAHPQSIEKYTSQPLPSAGIIPVVQSFCDDGDIYNKNNTRLWSFLEQFHKLVEHGDDVKPFLTTGSFHAIPGRVDDAMDVIKRLAHSLDNAPAVKLDDIMSNLTQLENGLETQYGISSQLTAALLQSSLNISQISRQLFQYISNNVSSGQNSDTVQQAALFGLLLNENSMDSALQNVLFKPKVLRELMCSSAFTQVVLSGVAANLESIKTLQTVVCKLGDAQLVNIAKDLTSYINVDLLISKLGLPDDIVSELNRYPTYMQELGLMFEVLENIGNLVKYLPRQSCGTSISDSVNVHESKNKTAIDKYAGLVKFWKLLEPALCGHDDDIATQYNVNSSKIDKRDVTLTKSQEKYIQMLTHLLYHNPKILFAPNNTAAHRIIQKVNASFTMYTNLTLYTKQWMNSSSDLRREALKMIHVIPGLINGIQPTFMQQLSPEQIPQNITDVTINSLFDVIDNMACTWLNMVSGVDFDVFRGFKSEIELEDYFLNRQYHDNVTVVAGLVFENLNSSSDELPAHIRYKIRQNATLNPPTNQVRKPFWFPSPGSNNLKYYDFGFVWVQDTIERAIIDIQAGREVSEPGLFIKRMPYPCWLWDQFVWLIQHILPLCLMLSWVYSVAMLVQRIVYEKEKRLKEVMKMMGLSNGVHWCAWFITAFVQMTVTMVILTLMLHYGHVLPHSSPWIVFIFLELFAISSIAFSFLICSFFSNAKLAAACAGIFYFLSYVPYMYIAISEDVTGYTIPVAIKTGSCVFSTTALGLGGKYFLFYELEGVGVQWSNVMVSPREYDEFNLMLVMLMMCLDTFLYLLLAWYIENIHPGTYGLPKPWYFPFLKSYWCDGHTETVTSCSLKQLFGIKAKSRYQVLNDHSDIDDELLDTGDSGRQFEPEPDDLLVGVTVTNLSKVYVKGGKPALDKFCVTLYEDQITSLLGHNGAGKTTLMSLLTGMFAPTSGTASIYGQDIGTDMDGIRHSLGMCPQYNVLFDSLTVEEHLWFYARLKGMTNDDIQRETKIMLKDLNLLEKRTTMPTCLSGGMQRKLSVAIAFVGGSRTVILDEPTAGVDPYSRRAIWNLLTKYKTGRTILLSTHHMDEAEILSDRVAIISNGKLKCSGTPLYLKTALGEGQHLHILKCDDNDCSASVENTNTTLDILSKVRETILSAYLKSSIGNQLHIILPINSDKKGMLVTLFEMLEKEKDNLNIKCYGIMDSGLEEVFIQVTEENNSEEDHKTVSGRSNPLMKSKLPFRASGDQQSGDLHLYDFNVDDGGNIECDDSSTLLNDTDIGLLDESLVSSRYHGCCKHFRHLKALMSKRLRYACRNRKGLFSQIFLPAVFVSISMTIALSAPQGSDPLPMTMSPSQYFNLTHPRGNFIPYSIQKDKTTYIKRKDGGSKELIHTFKLPSGIGATCVLKSPYHSRYDLDVIKSLNISFHNFELFAEYFEESCRGVFLPGIKLQMYMPSANIIKPRRNEESVQNDEGNLTNLNYYPQCSCRQDGVGFQCSNDGVVQPPSYTVVTRDILQDISRTNEDEFYLYTTDDYRLHRYGGFTFGTMLDYVPDTFGNKETFDNVMRKLVVKETAQVRFNQKGFHSIPVYVNTMNNAILRANLPTSKGNPAAYGITLINHPMKKTNNILDADYIAGGTDVLMAIFIIVAMAFVPASFVVFLVHERSIKAKHLQFLSGVNPIVYWISNYIWDMFNYLIPAVCIVCVLLAFHIPAYTSGDNFEAVVLLFLLYGWSITPMMYPASFVFNEPSVAYIILIVVNLFTGITCVVCSFMLEMFSDDKNLSELSDILKNVFLVFPNYCLGNGLMTIALNQYKNEFYSNTGQNDKILSPLSWDITGRRLVVMATAGIVFFILNVLCEYGFFINCRKRTNIPESTENQDEDVEAERDRTIYGTGKHDLLRLENLTKVYKTRKRGDIIAVDGLSLSIPRGECFGFLGVNGAGKTSTFKMLTGDVKPTSGDAKLSSYSILKDIHTVQQNIGYCPQFDALFDQLTPREHLKLYARLRDISSKHEGEIIQQSLDRLSLTKYADQPTGTLSGGNKRKLSTSISLLGNPPLIYMDEPTTGMDPYSKRFLWDLIRKTVQEGKSVIFTSHSMEECETLCSRLTIMVNGHLKCLGSIQHLKDKYGDGYSLTVSLNDSQSGQRVREYIELKLPICELNDKGHKTLCFDINMTGSRLADVYREMERVVEIFDIAEYSLSQKTLDNVFINFAKQQNEIVKDLAEASNTDAEEINPDHRDCFGIEEDIQTQASNRLNDEDEALIDISPRTTRLEINYGDELLLPL